MSTDKKSEDINNSSSPARLDKKDRIENWLKIAGLFFTGIALLFTYFTYRSAEKWKVNEFSSVKFHEFSENKSVKYVNELLDYKNSLLPLGQNDSIVSIDDDNLLFALGIDTADITFPIVSANVRSIFDTYFDQLSLFNRYVKANLITYEQIKPYLEYQITIIGDTANRRKTNELRKEIWEYIDFYNFHDVQELFQHLGYDISVKKIRP